MTQIAMLQMAQLMPDEAMTVIEPQAVAMPNAVDIVRFETAPDEQMQVDWVEFRKGRQPLYACRRNIRWPCMSNS